MPKSIRDLMDAPESDSPFESHPRGEYGLVVVNATYQESFTKDDGAMIAPKVRIQAKIESAEDAALVGRTAFITQYIDQDRGWGFTKKLYKILSGSNLLDGFSGTYVENDELAQKFAAGIVNGRLTAVLAPAKNRAGENVISKLV